MVLGVDTINKQEFNHVSEGSVKLCFRNGTAKMARSNIGFRNDCKVTLMSPVLKYNVT